MKVRFAVSPAGAAAGPDGLAEVVDGLEARGFDGLWLSDVPLAPTVDPMVGLAFAAGRTRRLKLGANVVPLGRSPLLLAKELAQLDRMSGGRLLLSFVPGIGAPGEREALGVAGLDRGRLIERVLGQLRSWWSGQAVEAAEAAEGRWSFAGVAPPARPLQQPLEVWLGGSGPKALERAGRVADGWLGAALPPAEAGPARRAIERAAAAAGRVVDPEHFGLSIGYARTEPDAAVLAGLRARRPDLEPHDLVPVGSAGLGALVRAHVDQGLSKFVLRPLGPVESWEAELDWLGEAILHLQS